MPASRLSTIHPRMQQRLDETMRRRMEHLAASRDSTRAGLERAVTLLTDFAERLGQTAVLDLRHEAETLRDDLDRLAALVPPDGARIEALTSRLFRFAEALNALKAGVNSGESA